jgi:type IV pilus assembly protein PilQ
VDGQPGLDTQSTQTKVLVNDGGTVVIGGVVITNQNTTINQVPLLGNVPLIGNLFKHTSISTSTQELMFFVTPRILPG